MNLVKCISCNLIWEYISEDEKKEPIQDPDAPGSYIIKLKQIICPKCNSNAFQPFFESKKPKKKYKELLIG